MPVIPRLLIASACAAMLALPPAAQAAATPILSAAPGRVVLAVDDGSVRNNVDPTGASDAVALPDGRTLIFGTGAGPAGVMHVARIGPSGFPDLLTTIPVPPGRSFSPSVLRQDDGKLLLASARPQASNLAPEEMLVTRLNADLTLDRGYGVNGTAATGVGAGGMVLQPDGALVVAGTTGTYGAATPTSLFHLHPAVTRLTPDGTIDRGFGDGGVATIPTTLSASAFNVALGPGGTLVVEGQSQAGAFDLRSNVVVARLTAAGVQDPAFNGGRTIELPFDSGQLMLVQDDGSVVVNGELRPAGSGLATLLSPSRQLLARITPAGALDASFGSGGVVDLGADVSPQQLLPGGGRALLVAGTPAYTLAPGSHPVPGRIIVRRLAADGSPDPAFGIRTVDLPFGGGGSSFVVSVHPRPLAPLVQNSFTGTRLVPRPDGSYIVAGSVGVHQPTGEGEGLSIGRFGVVALTPVFALDPGFGAPAAPLRIALRLVRQRARTARAAHGIRVKLDASAVGLVRVKILHRGRAIAQSVLPVFEAAPQTLPVELTHYGNAYLRGHRDVSVTVRATWRDLLTTTTTATATTGGRLR